MEPTTAPDPGQEVVLLKERVRVLERQLAEANSYLDQYERWDLLAGLAPPKREREAQQPAA